MKPLLLIFILLIVYNKNALCQMNSLAAEQVTYYEYDALGNTVSLSNNIGSLIENYSYTAFGEPVITNANHVQLTASGFDNRFMFTGREFIQQLNMYDYRNRFYLAFIGRFIQTDPLRFEADDYNIYRYVFNSSLNLIDPSGLYFCYKGKYADETKRQIEKWLATLPKNSELRKILEDLRDSWSIYTIGQLEGRIGADGNQIQRPYTVSRSWFFNTPPSATYIDFKPYTFDGRTWTFPEALAHEMLHAHDYYDHNPKRGSAHSSDWMEQENRITKEAN